MKKIIGIDLAWQSERNTTAVAVGELSKKSFRITKVHDSISSIESLIKVVNNESAIAGVSIDAPLIINNTTGQRSCERELSKEYGSRKSSCHSSNITLYPNAASVDLANHLSNIGFIHLGNPSIESWQIECYPHPAIIEIFGLQERLAYKKDNVAKKKKGQIVLASSIKSLSNSEVLSLFIDQTVDGFLLEERISEKFGVKLKQNEDVLDSILCAYIGALYAMGASHKIFGNSHSGYIYIPTQKCI